MKAYYEDKEGYIILFNEIIAINRVECYVLLRNQTRLEFTSPTPIAELKKLIVAFKEFHDYHENRFIETHDNNINLD